ncbi:MAG: murein biosynthesis integral membrane protein MurJ [Mycobacterium sp.]
MTPPNPMAEPPETDARPARAELSDAAVVSRSWGMAFATLISRITGFIRIVLLAAILGAALSSSFTVANQLPNLVAALVLEATFTAIFVPVLARAERDDPDGGTAFVRRLVTLAITLLAVTTVLSVAAAPLLVRLMLGDDPKVDQPLTTAFAYLLLPQVIFYGLSSVFMAILNNRNHFAAPAWAPVVNNVVAIATLGLFVLVPGDLSTDPVRMGTAKLLVLGIGTTLGVVAQTAVLLIAIRRERISLRPLWGIDDRLKRFGAMAAAMVLYVLISQFGLVVGNQIASAAAASGPAIYNYTWLVLMLPFGMIGVTVLTVVMPRLSRNAAAEDTPAVLADFSLATRLTMITLIPIVAFMTVGGPAIGSALFAYGKFGEVDANYLGISIALSSFTLIPYALVLLELRVFYAREQPWIPILIVIAITTVKIAASLAAPHVTDNPELVAGYLGAANGLGFLAGAVLGYFLLRRALRPDGGQLVGLAVVRTVLVTMFASLLASLVGYAADRLLGLDGLTTRWGGAGSLLRLAVLGLIMLPIVAAVIVAARVPEARAAVAAIRRRLSRGQPVAPVAPVTPDSPTTGAPVTYPMARKLPVSAAGPPIGKGPEVTDEPSGLPRTTPPDATVQIPRPADNPTEIVTEVRRPAAPAAEALIPGTTVANGRYRLLVFHGGPPGLQFWQALDTALDRQVALTFVDPDGTMTPDAVREILSRTSQLSRIDRPGIARVLDVASSTERAGGLVVSEWIRGGSLREVAETAPSPVGGARAIQSLAAAADAAHQDGIALSVDHPSRIRVSIDGDVALAFPATLPDATPEDDIRGIGAALYALLVDRWPLREAGNPSGMRPADLDATGQPVEPRTVNRSIPFQISAAAVRSVQDGGGIRTAPTLLNLLQQATAVADRTEQIGAVGSAPQAGTAGAPSPAPETGPDDDEARARRRRTLMIGLASAGVVLVVALIVLATVLSRIFGDVGGSIDGDQLGLNPTTSASNAATGSVVKPVKATVFSPEGGADAPSLAGLAIDGDPATMWPVDTYTDPTPFPNFKNGVGLMLDLPEPTKVGSVDVGVTSTGTKIQIRAAESSSPSTLEDTTALTQPTAVQAGNNTIKVNATAPTSHLLVWISTLGTVDGKNRSDITEITVRAAG